MSGRSLAYRPHKKILSILKNLINPVKKTVKQFSRSVFAARRRFAFRRYGRSY